MAVSAIAAGAVTTEVRVAGFSGGLSASTGFFSGGDGHKKRTVTISAAMNAITPIRIVRRVRPMPKC